MSILDFLKKKTAIKANGASNYWSGANMLVYDGEKTPYELGTPSEFSVDYQALRMRAWEAYLKTDVVQNAIRKYCLWIIGAGLKLQSEPVKSIINKSGNLLKYKALQREIEDNFRLYAATNNSSYNQNENIHSLGVEALKTALLSGDCLCVSRFDGKKVTMQIIDGAHVQTPMFSTFAQESDKRGNTIKEGVEVDKTGKHIAYYIYTSTFNYERIEAYGANTGYRQAWLMVGLKYKSNSIRGISLLSAVLESTAKLDRYKEATIGSAEENSKIPYTIEHNQFSDGENPLINQLAQSMGKKKGIAPETDPYYVAENIASKIAQTTSKQAYNMPIGASLKKSTINTDLNFRDFFEINMDIIYATIGISPEVALDRFAGSYSSSRAALKSWEYKMTTDRILMLKNQFYKPFFDFWLNIQVLSLKIDIPGYLLALKTGDYMYLEAVRNCRFIGATVPHIDPLKEVNAERKKLGSAYDRIPLTSAEQSCEQLNTGDYDSVIDKAISEIEIAEKFIIKDEADINL